MVGIKTSYLDDQTPYDRVSGDKQARNCTVVCDSRDQRNTVTRNDRFRCRIERNGTTSGKEDRSYDYDQGDALSSHTRQWPGTLT